MPHPDGDGANLGDLRVQVCGGQAEVSSGAKSDQPHGSQQRNHSTSSSLAVRSVEQEDGGGSHLQGEDHQDRGANLLQDNLSCSCQVTSTPSQDVLHQLQHTEEQGAAQEVLPLLLERVSQVNISLLSH